VPVSCRCSPTKCSVLKIFNNGPFGLRRKSMCSLGMNQLQIATPLFFQVARACSRGTSVFVICIKAIQTVFHLPTAESSQILHAQAAQQISCQISAMYAFPPVYWQLGSSSRRVQPFKFIPPQQSLAISKQWWPVHFHSTNYEPTCCPPAELFPL
jgi:hypothetical protein